MSNFFNILALPSFFSFSLLVFVLVVPSSVVVQFLFLLNFLFLYIYFKSIYYFLFSSEFYKDNSLQNLSSYGNFLAFYFLSSAIYGMQILINASVFFLLFFVLLAVFLAFYQVFWVNNIKKEKYFIYIPLGAMLLVEIAWAVPFLTLNYFVLALILSVSYYVLIGLFRFYLLEKLNKTLVKIYLSVSLLAIFLVLLTSRWV